MKLIDRSHKIKLKKIKKKFHPKNRRWNFLYNPVARTTINLLAPHEQLRNR